MAQCEVRTLRRQQLRRREIPVDRLAESLPDRRAEHDPLVASETWKSVEGALNALSALDRDALWATFDRGHSGQALNAAVRKRKQRALERLVLKVQASLS
jgi:hypothetical protein